MASMVVRILESGLVAPAAETPRDSIWLSNLDLDSGLRTYTPTVYFYCPTIHDDPESFFSFERLREGLAKALVTFYPYAGTLGFDDNGRIELKCNGEGVRLVEAVCDSTIEEFGDFSPRQDFRKWFVPLHASADPPCPVVMFQVTRFRCGGVCLGAAVQHMIGDGNSTLYFINSWAAVTRGVDLSIIKPPHLDRTILRGRLPPRVKYDHSEHPKASAPLPAVSTAILRIAKKQLARLKGGEKGLTTFTTVASYAWRCVCKARNLDAREVTRLFIAVDVRDRFHPPLPREFLGNAVLYLPMELEVGDLLSGALGHATAKIDAFKLGLRDGYLKSRIDFLEQQEGPMRGPWALHPNDFFAISWLRLPIYEADFGWGQPLFMGRAELPYRGRLFITRSPSGDGSIYLTVAIEEEYMPAFKKCFYEELSDEDNQRELVF